MAAPSSWTIVVLQSDFTTTSSTAVDITGLFFTPQGNRTYEFEGLLLLRTATATVNPRVGITWPSGLNDGVVMIQQAQSATAQLMSYGNIGANVLTAVGGLPNTTQSWPARIQGIAVATTQPTGNLRFQVASETNGTTVTVKAKSFIKFRPVR